MKFAEFLLQWKTHDSIPTEDVLTCFLPLVRETLAAHQQGKVAPLNGVDELRVDHQRLWFEEHLYKPVQQSLESINRIESQRALGWDVVDELQRDVDIDTGKETINMSRIGTDSDNPSPSPVESRNVYLKDYLCWEHALGHHDPLTDTYSLGMLLASLALQLDFHVPDDLKQFVANRRNLFAINRSLHPVIAQSITQMTELYRSARSQDLRAILHSLENYRDQMVSLDVQMALDRLKSAHQPTSRNEMILTRLRDRLFDLSKRNTLLNFRSTSQALNLTQASMPLSIHVDNIKEDQLLVWNDTLQKQITKGKPIRLNQRINFNEALYASSVLERLMADARRDKNEFGFSQLRLVVAFIGWSNLKEKPVENFVSPLVLLPVQIIKQKGIRDTFSLEVIEPQAEVNPVIRHLFRQLYNIALPESIDLSSSSLDELYQLLFTQIHSNEPAVQLTRIDRPRIEVMHEKAKRRLDQYRRSSRIASRGTAKFEDIDYSYAAINYHPLGVRLFTQRVRQPNFRLQQIVSHETPTRNYVAPVSNENQDDSTLTVERKIAILQDSSSDNPYQWTFDLCNLTLVNLHYRRMSLVRDYEEIQQRELQNPAFDSVFTEKPRQVRRQLPETLAVSERYEVVPSDPTQSMAVAESRSGRSYIIQGPPGTGKSQTITNLIADFVAHGKRVLFVCEKRAAIDVVYARLKQCGLGSLCCLVHDSQTDKKEFILDLKSTYEAFIAAQPSDAHGSSCTSQRELVLAKLDAALSPLSRFEQAMESTIETGDASISMRELLDRCLINRSRCPAMTTEQQSQLPTLTQWAAHQSVWYWLGTQIPHLIPDALFSKHPLRSLHASLAQSDDAIVRIRILGQQSLEQLEHLGRAIKNSGIPEDQWSTLSRIHELTTYIQQICIFSNDGNLQLLDPSSARTTRFRHGLSEIARRQSGLDASRQINSGWKSKLTAHETRTALPQAKSIQSNPLRWLSGGYWRLRRILKSKYDFKRHTIQPTWVQILEGLEAEYQAEMELQEANRSLADELVLAQTPGEMQRHVEQWRDQSTKLPAWILTIHRALMSSLKAPDIIRRCQEVSLWLTRFRDTASQMLIWSENHSLKSLTHELQSILGNLNELRRVSDILIHLDSLPERMSNLVRNSDWTIPQLEAAIEANTWMQWLQSNPEVDRFSALEQEAHVQRLDEVFDSWLRANSEWICSRARERFLDLLRVDPSDQALSKRYQQGRKTLEHEFGKTMRYRAIRDLVDGDSGLIVKDLKPIWLMSPLSVSDTLPLNPGYVDVVIFDEASQVRLEEAIPSLFRGTQTIIVGDTMQLPPTNFFTQKKVDDEIDINDYASGSDNEEAVAGYDLSSDSLLSHSGKCMESTMLGWHYRSRSESLISFSNWAFYDGRLLTVPDPIRARPTSIPSDQTASASPQPDAEAVAVHERTATYQVNGKLSKQAEGSQNDTQIESPGWLDQPISFHLMNDGCYIERRNRREADYIADLVAEYLAKESGMSLGIIAFSEAQQAEIERALEDRARMDDAFRVRYEAELQREENGQFVGLLVKNLENIQGDERDIILLSICYGPNPQGSISMNFGPINRDGGEKRLNVAFSRAKRNMAVVSSIHHGQITNDYNLGPNCLKQYLRFVESMSTCDTASANSVLRQISRWRGSESVRPSSVDPVVTELSTALRSQGYLVDNQVGQSHFQVDVAVYREGDDRYRLGILVDSVASYCNSDPWERDLMRPRLLRDFGWRIARVLGKDWYRDPESELQRIVKEMA